MNFNSFCPISYKSCLVKTFLNRSRMVDERQNKWGINYSGRVSQKNGYPRNCITKYSKEYLKDDKNQLFKKNFIRFPFKRYEISVRIDRRVKVALKQASLLLDWFRHTTPSVHCTIQSQINTLAISHPVGFMNLHLPMAGSGKKRQ